MRHFPIFLDMDRTRVIVSGGGDAALAKLRLLLKTNAAITVHALRPLPEIRDLARNGRLHLTDAPLDATALSDATLVYAADEDAARDAATMALARAAGVLGNIVDDLEGSDFITPAMVDRAPLTIAIGTEGAAPMLARAVKRDLEERLPAATAELARAAQAFRPRAEALPHGRARRAFWAEWFESHGPAAHGNGTALEAALETLLKRHLSGQDAEGRITLTFTASADPDLMTLKARKALDSADVVIHDDDIAPGILELARREARLISLAPASNRIPPLHQLLALEADGGAHVLYISGAPLSRSLGAACRRSGITVDIIPGIAARDAAQLKETA
ncbi:siroheme synthase [Pseudooceanicola sp. CBS1P-1]|uniref:precorrin-2 dehydrogenase n=1 Tax=Pseudooceanicola albus TaxID=2692189 RepID=A0A6L7G0J3_9RHOB|nr:MULTISPECIES: NAD(P)-dependent oxidoreductase [Pseudooceanicola]MBT9382467.1 siroheme synthase [Pseudooceanicola endophyticus]MXN17008.1 siroheme synthase [Pseudooceanicola albus]